VVNFLLAGYLLHSGSHYRLWFCVCCAAKNSKPKEQIIQSNPADLPQAQGLRSSLYLQ
jgi:hypothetical protein